MTSNAAHGARPVSTTIPADRRSGSLMKTVLVLSAGPGLVVRCLRCGASHSRRLPARAIAAPAVRIGGDLRPRHADVGRHDASLLLPPLAGQRLRVRDGRCRHAAEAAGVRSHAARRVAVARLGTRLLGHAAAVPELHLQRRPERDRDDDRRRAVDLHARRLRLPHAGGAAARRDPARHHRPGARRSSGVTPRPRMSPDGKWMAFIDNYNVAIRPFGGDKRMALSTDGSEGNYYDGASIVVVAGFDEARRLSRAPRLSPPGALRRVVAGRSTAAASTGRCIRQARRSARSRAAGAVRRPQPEADRDRLARCSRIRTTCPTWCGARTAAASPSSTTSAATRCFASSKSTRRPAPRAR